MLDERRMQRGHVDIYHPVSLHHPTKFDPERDGGVSVDELVDFG